MTTDEQSRACSLKMEYHIFALQEL